MPNSCTDRCSTGSRVYYITTDANSWSTADGLKLTVGVQCGSQLDQWQTGSLLEKETVFISVWNTCNISNGRIEFTYCLQYLCSFESVTFTQGGDCHQINSGIMWIWTQTTRGRFNWQDNQPINLLGAWGVGGGQPTKTWKCWTS